MGTPLLPAAVTSHEDCAGSELLASCSCCCGSPSVSREDQREVSKLWEQSLWCWSEARQLYLPRWNYFYTWLREPWQEALWWIRSPHLHLSRWQHLHPRQGEDQGQDPAVPGKPAGMRERALLLVKHILRYSVISQLNMNKKDHLITIRADLRKIYFSFL